MGDADAVPILTSSDHPGWSVPDYLDTEELGIESEEHLERLLAEALAEGAHIMTAEIGGPE